jgi:hypothetical protein
VANDSAPSTPPAASAPAEEEPVSEAEHQHIANLARRANTAVPVLKTQADVKAAQEQLTVLVKQRRTNRDAQGRVSGA